MLISGRTLREVKEFSGLSTSTLDRHKLSHLPTALIQARTAHLASGQDKLLVEIDKLYAKAGELCALAESKGKIGDAIRAIQEARSCLGVLIQLAAELRERDWAHMRDRILDILRDLSDTELGELMSRLDVPKMAPEIPPAGGPGALETIIEGECDPDYQLRIKNGS
jgi:hypothetical protein